MPAHSAGSASDVARRVAEYVAWSRVELCDDDQAVIRAPRVRTCITLVDDDTVKLEIDDGHLDYVYLPGAGRTLVECIAGRINRAVKEAEHV